MYDDDDEMGCGCGCLACIVLAGGIIMFCWGTLHGDASPVEKFLFYAFVICGIIFAILFYFTAIVDKWKSESGKGGNSGCLFSFLNPGSSIKSSNSSQSEYITIGTIEQPTQLTSGGRSDDDYSNNDDEQNGDKFSDTAENEVKNAPGTSIVDKRIIDEHQFGKLKISVNRLNDFCFGLARDRELRDYMIGVAHNDGIYIDNDEESIGNLFYQLAMKDVFNCMKQMGCSVDSLTESTYLFNGNHVGARIKFNPFEGQMLFGLIFIGENRYASYSDFEEQVSQALNGKTTRDANNAGVVLCEYMKSKVNVTAEDVHDYQLALVLGSISMDDESRKYKQILYNISSCFAYADGLLSQKEKAFLKKLGDDAGVVETGITVDGTPNASVESLNSLIGLTEVKQSIASLVNFITVNQKRASLGMKTPKISYHCVFTGNPGTGKTTVARILAGIYKGLGILKKGQLVETDRSGLVAEYVGQTAVKTNKIIDKALGGVLFIDEAYSLVGGGEEDYGKEAIATLLKRMEDDRDKLIVILAGYSKEMEDFINSNPGLRSRFSRYIYFPDYSADELYQIFLMNAQKFEYNLTAEAGKFLLEKIKERVANKPKDFGNAREVRNLFEKVVEAQSDRLLKIDNVSKSTLSEITVEDIKKACS